MNAISVDVEISDKLKKAKLENGFYNLIDGERGVMKAHPKTEAPFGPIHNVRRKTFISLPFTGGLAAFAVILPHSFPW